MDLKLDTTTKDILITSGEPSFTSGVDSIKQHLEIRLQTFAGEWFLNESIGLTYFDDVFKKNPDLTILNTIFTKLILDTPGIIALDALTFSLENTRQLSISLTATTAAGVFDYSGFVGL
jgi:hypothetical protein